MTDTNTQRSNVSEACQVLTVDKPYKIHRLVIVFLFLPGLKKWVILLPIITFYTLFKFSVVGTDDLFQKLLSNCKLHNLVVIVNESDTLNPAFSSPSCHF